MYSVDCLYMCVYVWLCVRFVCDLCVIVGDCPEAC